MPRPATRQAPTRRARAQPDGSSLSGEALFERVTGEALRRKEERCRNRCPVCWFDARSYCICERVIPGSLSPAVNVKVLVLMHAKEYLNAGDDAKLLLTLLPPERRASYIYGKPGDLAALRAELAIDPEHTLLLWPGDGALTVETYLARLAPPARFVPDAADGAAPAPPLLRVLVLDGVYSDANGMFRHLRKDDSCTVPPHVALHPTTLSVYRRAQHGYAGSVGADPEALRICTVEAVALLLEELGEPKATTAALVAAVEANNAALACTPGSSGVNPEPKGRRARRRRREAEAEAAAPAAPAAAASAAAEPASSPPARAASVASLAAGAVGLASVLAIALLWRRLKR